MENKSTTSGKGGHYILIAKLFFTLMGIFIVLIGLPWVFGSNKALYGGYQIVLSKISLINMLLITGTIQAVARFTTNKDYSNSLIVNGVYRLQAVLGFLVGIIFYFIAPLIVSSEFQSLVPTLRVAGLIPVFYGFYAINIGVLNGNKLFKVQAGFDISFAFMRFLAIVGGSYLALRSTFVKSILENNSLSSLFAPYSAWAGLAALFAFISYFIIRPLLKKDTLETSAAFPYKEFLSFAGVIILFNFFFYAIVQMDIITLEFFLPATQIPADFIKTVNPFTTEFNEILAKLNISILDAKNLQLDNKSLLSSFPALSSYKEMLESGKHLMSEVKLAEQVKLSYIGLYSMPLNIARLSFTFITSVALVMFPNISTLAHSKDEENIGKSVIASLRLSYIVLFLLAIGIFSAGPYLLNLLPGSYGQGDGPAFTRYLSFSQIILSFLNILLILLIGIGRVGLAALISLLTAFFYMLLNYFLIPVFGAFGAIYGSFAVLIPSVFVAAFYLKKNIKLSVPWKGLSKAMLSALLAAAIVFVIPSISGGKIADLINLVYKGVFVVSFYFVGLFLLKELQVSEIKKLLSYLGLAKGDK